MHGRVEGARRSRCVKIESRCYYILDNDPLDVNNRTKLAVSGIFDIFYSLIELGQPKELVYAFIEFLKPFFTSRAPEISREYSFNLTY